MNNGKDIKPQYSSWVSSKIIIGPAVLFLICGVLSVFLPFLTIFSVLFFLLFLYFLYARYMFSPHGANIQNKLQNVLMEQVSTWHGNGKILDIGCGNGPLAIAIARKFPRAIVTGVDTWGKSWDYSNNVCKRNARIEGVEDRVFFQQASASSLPFEDGSFDLVISNMVFHEVRDTLDKKEVLKEAFRVLKPEGKYVFQDLFLWKSVYGRSDDLVKTIKTWGIKTVELIDTSKADFIPVILKLPFMVGTAAILHGEK
jgi:ubiquinone/menaquinone biosynthesis C-methylase UbiE